MKVRAALAAVVIGASAVSAVGVSPDASASGGSATSGRGETVTVTGDFERVVVETVDGEEIRYAVRGVDRTWWLEGVAEPVPAPGSAVEVTGTPRDEYTLTVATIRVTGGGTSALQTSVGGARDDEGAGATGLLGRPPAGPADDGDDQAEGDHRSEHAGSAKCPTGATRSRAR